MRSFALALIFTLSACTTGYGPATDSVSGDLARAFDIAPDQIVFAARALHDDGTVRTIYNLPPGGMFVQTETFVGFAEWIDDSYLVTWRLPYSEIESVRMRKSTAFLETASGYETFSLASGRRDTQEKADEILARR